MCDIGALSLAPYLVPVFAGSLLMGISLMCFMQRSYDKGVTKTVAQLAFLEQQVREQAPPQHVSPHVSQPMTYYPPQVSYAVRPSAPL